MVARNRKTYTCTVGQIVVVVAVVAKRETRTQIVTVAAINQSINQDPVYTGKYCLHGSGQSFERANCLPIQPIYAEPCKFCYSTACKQVRTNFCQSQLWTGFLIKGAELGSTLLTRKLSKKFHGRTDRTGQNFRPTADQVKNLHGLYGPSCVCEMRIRARFCPFNNLSGPVKLHVRYWKKKKKRKCLYQNFFINCLLN